MWERELLSTSFLRWKRYSSKEWRIIEQKTKELGKRAVIRYCFHRWKETHEVEARHEENQIHIFHTRNNNRVLRSHYTHWSAFNRCRGKRIRETRKLWKQWISFIYRQQEDRRLLILAIKSIQISRKAHILSNWINAKSLSSEARKCTYERMEGIGPKIISLLSLWIKHSPRLFIRCYFEAWKRARPPQNSIDISMKKCNTIYDDSPTTSVQYNKRNFFPTSAQTSFNDENMSIICEEETLDDFQEAKRTVYSRQRELDLSLQNIHESKRKILATEKNITMQKRTIHFCKKELDNHCCICSGIHIPSSGHVPFKRPECATYKTKQQVYNYLSASLKKSNLDLKQMKLNVENGIKQNKLSKVNMNDSLISFIESSLCISCTIDV